MKQKTYKEKRDGEQNEKFWSKMLDAVYCNVLYYLIPHKTFNKLII